jgi:hypothetical protein
MKNSSNLMKEARAALALHPQCGAKCKQSDGYCRNPAMQNGRCRIHGGNSTGPKPKHGQASAEAKLRRSQICSLLRNLQQI